MTGWMQREAEDAERRASEYGNQESLNIPDGWQLVPIQATKEMIWNGTMSGGVCHSDYKFDVEECWDDMLRFAPKYEDTTHE